MDGKRWVVQDRFGNQIYLTQERWKHIIAPENHPGMAGYEKQLQDAIKSGERTQDTLIPNKYYYRKAFENLPDGNNYIIAVTVFKLTVDDEGHSVANNFIVTAYQTFIYR
ncbi:MAG: hypothetical protein AAB342_01020 [Chloroflexota bacterium]